VSDWLVREAPAKVNLALVVGPRRDDGKHEVVTVMERLSLSDTVAVRPSGATAVTGFEDDALVAAALDAVADATQGQQRFEARIEKRIPVAAGLGGGSSDAAAALLLANDQLDDPLDPGVLHSTSDVYADFDARRGENGYSERHAAVLAALAALDRPDDLARLPPNDLVTSPLADELRAAGALRADVTGAGPVVYALFATEAEAELAEAALEGRARTWIATPG
jgi:4-diphosphocytidyl-2C-methyl-D-erythritol kinase